MEVVKICCGGIGVRLSFLNTACPPTAIVTPSTWLESPSAIIAGVISSNRGWSN